MWCFADRFGADKLVLALDADVAERSMLRHVDAGTVPDWRAMTMFATLNRELPPAGMPLDEIVDLDVVPRLSDLTFPSGLEDWSTPTFAPIDLSWLR